MYEKPKITLALVLLFIFDMHRKNYVEVFTPIWHHRDLAIFHIIHCFSSKNLKVLYRQFEASEVPVTDTTLHFHFDWESSVLTSRPHFFLISTRVF